MSSCLFHNDDTKLIQDGVDEYAFLEELVGSRFGTESFHQRRAECQRAVEQGLGAPLTHRELTLAARIAWRNQARCIGRLFWKTLRVIDRREVKEADDIFEALCQHLALASNGGNIQPVMTVFGPHTAQRRGPRIWNHQLCGYAAYREASGRILGDPRNLAFTQHALAMGWRPANRTAFDILPLIIDDGSGRRRLYEFPAGAVLEVPLRHPRLAWFEDLKLRWYTVPVISDMRFRAAATDFTAAPFNGWYMVTEIAARDLADESRYNQLPVIAERMGFNLRTDTLWKDYALVELNAAVLHSFAREGVRIVDHHSASEEFMRFCERENRAGRSVSARWDWIVPPMSAATMRVFHTTLTEYASTPDFYYQTAAWAEPLAAKAEC
jgi:nitric-oxide synthase